ncbi:MAG: ribonuclease P protein component [Candidatus Omnitrophica bacterium]|nr:ribonuclease P protein component [Candidatus Omnitrophota bacterium]MDD5310200.1 ribonuclease P protein component [Candidatus Omnitrophota bacterium]MDD5546223.1 ribonuclease P protein component [Candidatus Omnitrophota bacterium]
MKRFSLSRPERITKTSDFKQALKSGSFYNGRALKLSISRNDRGVSRIGVSLRKHIFKLAVSRNKLRRHIKEAFRLNKEKLEKGYDIVAIPGAAAAGLGFEGLSAEFLALLKKAGILRD